MTMNLGTYENLMWMSHSLFTVKIKERIIYILLILFKIYKMNKKHNILILIN